MKKFYFYLLGAITGAVNGIFGSGGGTIAVPMLEKASVDSRKAHASSIAITLPLSVISAIFYAYENTFSFRDALPLIPFGIAGTFIGSHFLKKVPTAWLKQIFGIFLIISGGRLIL